MRTQVLFFILAVVALTGMAFADQVIIQENTGGNVITFAGVTPGTQVSVSIPTTAVAGSSSINGAFVPADSAVGTSISGLTFNYSNTGVFTPGNQAIQIGGASSGTLSGTVTFVSLTSVSPGAFALNIGLGGLSFANCSAGGCTNSALLSAFGATGNGILTFQFVSGTGPQSISDLLNLGTGVNDATTFSATLANVPEPGSLAMFGTGLIGLVGIIRRKLVR